MPQYANSNWYNAHNFYGDLKDLDAATLGDVQNFFKTYYAPNNAAMAVVGDIDSKQTLAWIQKYFGAIPAAKLPPPPDISEPRQEKEKRATKTSRFRTTCRRATPPSTTPWESWKRSSSRARTAASTRPSSRRTV
jgi:Zn-dependent M16 (insulinase) family peptidase